MKIKMCKLNEMNIDVSEIKNMKFKNKKNQKGNFTLILSKQIYVADINNAFDYWYLYDFLRKICPDNLYKRWLSEMTIRDIQRELKSVMTLIKIDRVAKDMNIEIIHDTVVRILLDDYEDFGFNALKYGNFNKNVKKAIYIHCNRMAV